MPFVSDPTDEVDARQVGATSARTATTSKAVPKMANAGNLTVKRFAYAVAGSPLLGGFAWGVLNPSSGMEGLIARFVDGVLAAPMFVFVMFARPSRLPSWLFVAAAFLLLLFIAIRWSRSTGSDTV